MINEVFSFIDNHKNYSSLLSKCFEKYIGKIGNKKDNDMATSVTHLGHNNNN